VISSKIENNQESQDKLLDDLKAKYYLRNLRVRKRGSERNNFVN